MKKHRHGDVLSILKPKKKILLMFKWTCLLTFAFCVNVVAKGFSQKVNIEFQNTELRNVLKLLQDKSGTRFLFSEDMIPDSKISDKFTDTDVLEVLNKVLENTGLSYNILNGNLIVISKSAVEKQQQTIDGYVKDKTGQPLPGVTVKVLGGKAAASTDINGHYTLRVPNRSVTLTFSFLGFENKQINADGKQQVNVVLAEVDTKLDEVVVVGYGTVKKRDLTGAVVSVKGAEVTKTPSTTVMESLQGKIPGADITRSSGYAGANPTVRLRGNRSIANPGASNNVLYIVDGIQGVNIADIDPNDIQSVEVLKDASSTAIYGSRGANGVIIVTTKHGSADKAQISLNSYGGISEVSNYGEWMSGPEYIAFRREAYRAAGTWNSPADDSKIFNPVLMDAIEKKQYLDWPDMILKKGSQQNHQVGISGGTEKTKVYFSGGYYNEDGLLRGDNFKRYTARLNADQTVNNWLSMGMQAQLAYNDNDKRRDPFNVASKVAPLGRVYDDEGKLILFPGNGTEVNPLADEQPNSWFQNNKATRVMASLYANVKIGKDFNIKSTLATNLNNASLGTFYSKNTIDGKGSNSRSSLNNTQQRNVSWENIFTYKKEVKDHSFAATGVTSYLYDNTTTGNGRGDNQLLPGQYFYNLAAATQNLAVTSSFSEWKLISFTGKLNYGYKGKYLFQLTGRSDGSSKLSKGNKWAFFPSASAAWRISDEGFLKNQTTLSDLKLRVSYGISGNDVIPPYYTQNTLTQIQFAYNDNAATGAYAPSTIIGNPNLKWELTATTNIGLDFGLIKNRISGTIDYYDARTRDLIFPFALPMTTGVGTIYRNIGNTRNRGIEIAVNTNNINTSDFSWSTSISFFANKEEITKLPNGNVIASDYRNSLIQGQPATIYYDYKKLGIWQSNEAEEAAKFGTFPGELKIEDRNNDSRITADDRTIIGSRVPKWSGGLSNDLRYKGFDLNFNFFARIGQWISSDYYAKFNRNGMNNGARVNYWTPENASNDYPRPHATRSLPYITTLTERKASFVKLRNVTFGYSLPKSVISKLKLQSVRVYLSGRNLASFSSIKDFDPENEGIIDEPLTRLYVFGANISF